MWNYHILSICRSRKLIPRCISLHRCFLSMNLNNIRCHELKSSFGNFEIANDGVNFPIYVVSRIQGLSAAVQSLSDEKCNGLSVKDIHISDESDVLNLSSIEELANAKVVVIDPKLLAYNYKNMPKLEWAHCTWAGVEPLFEIMDKKPEFILTKHSNEDFSEQMAEYVMVQILLLEKNFKSMWAAQTEKSWSKMQNCINFQNRRLKDLTLGILGVGNMGKAIAKFFKPHGSRVIGLSKRERKSNEFGLFDQIEISVAKILKSADYIINTLPSTIETIGLLNGNVLEACTKMPVLINVGRGNIINENTLCKAFENNWLSHAVLDVFQEEPLPADSLLWNLTNKVSITPHCAAISHPSLVAKDFISSYITYQQKKPLENVVDWVKGY